MKPNKIALVGLMGCGKSVISRALATKIKLPDFELDNLFEEKFKISIKEFFKKYGEASFRNEETLLLSEIIKNNSRFVLSTGGGIILRDENRNLLFNSEIKTIYLKAQPQTLYSRLKNDTTRPLLQVDDPLNELKKILNQREQYYLMSDLVIEVDNKTIDEIVEEILVKIL